jgi:L-gulonate 5-dehydrogenase
LLAHKHVDASALISHRIPFREAAAAFGLIDEHPQEVSKVILDFGCDEQTL